MLLPTPWRCVNREYSELLPCYFTAVGGCRRIASCGGLFQNQIPNGTTPRFASAGGTTGDSPHRSYRYPRSIQCGSTGGSPCATSSAHTRPHPCTHTRSAELLARISQQPSAPTIESSRHSKGIPCSSTLKCEYTSASDSRRETLGLTSPSLSRDEVGEKAGLELFSKFFAVLCLLRAAS